MATTLAILSNAQQHNELVRTLDSLKYAPGALKRQMRCIKQLEREVKETKERIKEMKKKTKQKRSGYEETSSSMVRRMVSTVAGRKEQYISRVQREEKEYIDALQTEMQERTRLGTLEDAIMEAEQAKIDLEPAVDLFQTLQTDLRALHSRVFNKTTRFPKNEEALEHLKIAQETCKSLKAQIEANEEATKVLKEVDELMKWTLTYIDEGLRCYDDWGMYGNGMLTQMEQEFRNAARALSQVDSLLSRARKLESAIQPLPHLEVYEPCMVGDIVVKYGVKRCNSVGMLTRIRDNKDEIHIAQATIQSEILSASFRIGQLKADLQEAEDVMNDSEVELDSVRREIWEQIVWDELGSTSGSESEIRSCAYDAVSNQVAEIGLKSRSQTISPPAYECLAPLVDLRSEASSSDGHSSLETSPTQALPAYPGSSLATSLHGHRFALHNILKLRVTKAFD